ncbi:MAG: dihydrofolate reductase [Saprospiraceae bacterium]
MIVSAIVAATENWVIGKGNEIPWYLSSDFKYFKKTTLNHHIVMGRHTYISIGRPLPKRTNVILTRNPFYAVQNCMVVHSIQEALELAYDNGEQEVFIIGGGKVYEKAMPFLDKVYLTVVHTEVEGDTFFPKLTPTEWKEISSSERQKADEKNDFDYTFKIFEKK